MKNHSKKTIWIACIVVVVMFSFSFILAPVYNALCRSTGLGGKINLTPYASQLIAPDTTHPITVQLLATNNANLPWEFYPRATSVKTFPEDNTKIIFHVKNNTKKTMTVQAIPSISPWQAAVHFHKIECFCFKKQILKGGVSLDMPVIFRIDKALPADIHVITLAYTLFDVTASKP